MRAKVLSQAIEMTASAFLMRHKAISRTGVSCSRHQGTSCNKKLTKDDRRCCSALPSRSSGARTCRNDPDP
jgi:hypothetical protein